MDRAGLGDRAGRGDRVPRTRGDGPAVPSDFLRFRTSCSPHTRGWTGMGCRDGNGHGWCSPHTRGWTGQNQSQRAASQGVPRTRGDGPLMRRRAAWGPPVFPAHAGMDRVYVRFWFPSPWVFPAHAGMDRARRAMRHTAIACSPHTRGWTGLEKLTEFFIQWCSPHTRGWTDHRLSQ